MPSKKQFVKDARKGSRSKSFDSRVRPKPKEIYKKGFLKEIRNKNPKGNIKIAQELKFPGFTARRNGRKVGNSNNAEALGRKFGKQGYNVMYLD